MYGPDFGHFSNSSLRILVLFGKVLISPYKMLKEKKYDEKTLAINNLFCTNHGYG